MNLNKMDSAWWGSLTHSITLRSVFLFFSDCTDKLTSFLRHINSRETMIFHVFSCTFTRSLWMTFPGDVCCELPMNIQGSPSSCSPVCHKLPVDKEMVMLCSRWHSDASHLRVRTFFHMGIFAFSWLMQCWIACWLSWRCGDEIAMTTLA